MAGFSLDEIAAMDRVASILGPLVTNPIIAGYAKELGLSRYVTGNNKEDKISSLLAAGLADGRRRATAEMLITALTMAAHARSLKSQNAMTDDDVDAVVREMRRLGLAPGELAQRGWRKALRKKAPDPPDHTPPKPPDSRPGGHGSPQSSPRPVVHETALQRVRELIDPAVNAQHRGRQLEFVVFDLLQKEHLAPERNIVIPGEQIDHSFVLDGQHYLVECKWETDPIGLPALHLFSAKVGHKAEGTFGVMLSMSGFVIDINEKASRGGRLNCVGLLHQDLIRVLEGRSTWTEIVRRARRAASQRSEFLITSTT